MKKILSISLLLASSAVTYGSHDPYDVSNLSFDEQIIYATALSSGLPKSMAFAEAKGIREAPRFGDGRKSRAEEEQESLDLIAAMRFEDPQWGGSSSGYDRRDRKSKDAEEAASLTLIAAMQLADQGGGGGFGQSPTVYRIQSHAKVADHRKTLAPIVEMLKKVQQGSDVHDLDAHVAANMATIHAISADFGIDNAALKAVDIKN